MTNNEEIRNISDISLKPLLLITNTEFYPAFYDLRQLRLL
jgi:hypothetical protein